MKRTYAAILALCLAACGPTAPNPYGTRTVSPGNCRDPQSLYADDARLLNQLNLATFSLAMPDAGMPSVTLSCDDINSDCLDFHNAAACTAGNAVAYYVLGENVLHIDPARANGEFAFSGAMNHELIHWYIAQGPHPERARLHICACGVTGAECWADGCGSALMSPTQQASGSSWHGDAEGVDPGVITLNHPVDLDVRFVAWAIAP